MGTAGRIAISAAALVAAGCSVSVTPTTGGANTTQVRQLADGSQPAGRGASAAERNTNPTGSTRLGNATEGKRLLPFVASSAEFNRSYDVTGHLVVHYFGTDHDVPPPRTAVSSWENVIATVFVRGETPIGQLGFSLGFSDQQRRMFHQLILFVPASNDPSNPRDGYINLPLKGSLRWTDAGIGTTLTSLTQDGKWLVSLQWLDTRQLLLSVRTAPGRSTPPYLDHGTITITAAGPAGDEWNALQVQIDTHASSGSVRGNLSLTPTVG